MKLMPGYDCALNRCKVPKKDWPTVPPCDICAKACRLEQEEPQSMAERLRALLGEDGRQEQVLLALVQRAAEGDLKAIQLVLDILGEKPPQEEDDREIRVVFDPGIEESAK